MMHYNASSLPRVNTKAIPTAVFCFSSVDICPIPYMAKRKSPVFNCKYKTNFKKVNKFS